RSHQRDIAGPTHGPYHAAATDILHLRCLFPPLKIAERGAMRRDVFEMLIANVRHPRDFRGDLNAMIGSARLGERRLLALAGEFGWSITQQAIKAILDGAERQ